MKSNCCLLNFLVAIIALPSARAFTYTNSTTADAFVRAAAPTLNYGGAGADSVSGTTATNGAGVANGAFDSFLRFNTVAMVAVFNSALGNDWVINRAALRVTEQGGPMNAVFNRGVGRFEVRWIANDTWTEGTGTPQSPAITGINYNSQPGLLNPGTDATLGIFTNAGVDVTLSFPLALPPGFLNDLRAGGDVGLFLTTVDAATGFTFSSRSFSTAEGRPYLEVSALARPFLIGLSFSGTDLSIQVTNGMAGQTYLLLTSTNVAAPVSQWSTIATNKLAVGGNFTVTAANAASADDPLPQFFILQTQ